MIGGLPHGGSFAFQENNEMSTTMRDKVITAAKAYATKRKAILNNPHLSETGRQEQLAAARKTFDDESKAILDKLEEGSRKPVKQKPTAASKEESTAGLAEFKEELQDTDDPGLTALNLIMRGRLTRVISSTEGRQVLEKAMEKAGVGASEIDRTITTITTAATKRTAQQEDQIEERMHGTPDTSDVKEETFWKLVLPSLVADIPEAVDRGSSVVVPVIGEDPLVVTLDGSGT